MEYGTINLRMVTLKNNDLLKEAEGPTGLEYEERRGSAERAYRRRWSKSVCGSCHMTLPKTGRCDCKD